MASLTGPRWLGLCATLAACSYYDASLLEGTPPGDTGGAGGTAAGGGAAGASGTAGGGSAGISGASGQGLAGDGVGPEVQLNGCSIKPIGPPKDAPAKKDGVEIALAVRRLDLGETITNGNPAYKAYGFDLDGYCTCPGESACKGADPDPNRYCDGPDGRDNAGGALVTDFKALLPDLSSKSLSKNLEEGVFSVVLRVSQYNGEANDDQVQVAWLGGAPLSKDGDKPLWDGQDTWPIFGDSYTPEDPSKPLYADANAYVRDRVLIATVPGGYITAGKLKVSLVSPLLVATLRPPSAAQPYWRIDGGTIAARWTTKDILSQLSQLKDPLSDKPLCTDNQFYAGAKKNLCLYADIPSNVQAQPNIPCDALSLAFHFDAQEARIGKTVPPGVTPNLCTPATDPANDSCESGAGGTGGASGASGEGGQGGS